MQPRVMEVMSSIQGEGIFVGERQIFIRLAGCNLRCAYCDTPGSFDYALPCQVEKTPGKGDFVEYPNPVMSETLVAIVKSYQPLLHHSVSLTGGEPLLFTAFIQELAPQLSELNLRIFLETNGTLPDALASVGHLIDIISMDIKLPSTSGVPVQWPQHQQFLEQANRLPLITYVKIVVAQTTPLAELRQAGQLIAGVNPLIPVILQPVTPSRSSALKSPEPEQIMIFHQLMREHIQEVRVIPQTHKILKVL